MNLVDQYNLIKDTRQYKLFLVVVGFVLLIAMSVTLSPAAQAKSFRADYTWRHWIGFFSWLISMTALLLFLKQRQLETGPILVPSIALLTGWGLITVWRLAPSLGLKQSIWLLVGTAGLIAVLPYTQTTLAYLRRYKYVWLTAGLILTSLTLIFGTNPSGIGPRLWLGCCGIFFQPSEPLKILLILYLAAYFADRQPFTRGLLPLIFPTIIVSGLACLILVIQRDLGTASIMIFIYASMIYIATEKKRLLLISFLAIAIAAVLGYLLFDVVQLRYEAWINPWLDPSGRSYQIVQSLIAIASGGVSGRGPGMGNPTLVPISFSDFIFTSIAEEFGLPGTIGLFIVILLFVFRAFSISLQAPNRHLKYLAAGIGSFIGSQSILIIGGNIRLLPLTGVTLPFISYGGSSLITSLFGLYLLIGIHNAPSPAIRNHQKAGPIFQLTGLIMAGFAALALVNSWWAVIRGPDLLTRTDNARRTISDRYIERGEILDRNDVPLSFSKGTSGEFTRVYPYQQASHVIGYTNSFFGQASAESSLDPILRGLENQSPWTIWVNHLLYGQPPPGLDSRLSIDIDLQTAAAELIGENVGAVVLLDADTGDILVMHSSPGYDANSLQDSWDLLNEDVNAPLINRAADGLYPPGPILGPFFLAHTQTSGMLPESIVDLEVETERSTFTCVTQIELPTSWEAAAAAGCPAPFVEFGLSLGEEGLSDLFKSLGFYQTPDIRLEITEAFIPDGFPTPTVTAFGQADMLISPLQLAIAASAITNGGTLPSPNFLLEAEAPDDTWISYQNEASGDEVFLPLAANQTAQNLANEDLPIWEATSYAVTSNGQRLTWYIGGSLPASEGVRLTAVVLLEKSDPPLAATIGQQLLLSAGKP